MLRDRNKGNIEKLELRIWNLRISPHSFSSRFVPHGTSYHRGEDLLHLKCDVLVVKKKSQNIYY
jgi:hypothetical protein